MPRGIHQTPAIGTILRAGEVLRAFDHSGTLRFRDIVARTGLPRAAAHRILHSLAAAQLIETAKPKGYRSLVSLAAPRRYRIGYASQNEHAQFPSQLTSGLVRAAQAHGVDLIVVDNQYEPRSVIRNAQFLIDQRVDLVIEFATFHEIASRLAGSFEAAQIPLISVESSIPGAVFYGANNYQAGLLAGRALGRWARLHWKGGLEGVLLIDLPGAGPLPGLRLNGVLAGIREILTALPDAKVVRLDGRNTFDGALQAVTDWLPSTQPGRYLIGAINDPSALGALAALDGWPGGNFVAVGQSATLAARQEMRLPHSRLIGSVAYFPEHYGEYLIRLALELIQHRPVPQNNFVTHRLVTPANVDRLFPEDRCHSDRP